MMTHLEFVDRVVTDGIRAAKHDYNVRRDGQKLRGAISGFETCRGKDVSELTELLEAARIATEDAFQRDAPDYWWYRCYQSEVEWVCNCVSACLLNQGLPVIVQPTARGIQNAARIVGIANE